MLPNRQTRQETGGTYRKLRAGWRMATECPTILAPEGPSLVAMGGSPWKVCPCLTSALEGPSKAPTFPGNVPRSRPDWKVTARDGIQGATSQTNVSGVGPSGTAYRGADANHGFPPMASLVIAFERGNGVHLCEP